MSLHNLRRKHTCETGANRPQHTREYSKEEEGLNPTPRSGDGRCVNSPRGRSPYAQPCLPYVVSICILVRHLSTSIHGNPGQVQHALLVPIFSGTEQRQPLQFRACNSFILTCVGSIGAPCACYCHLKILLLIYNIKDFRNSVNPSLVLSFYSTMVVFWKVQEESRV